MYTKKIREGSGYWMTEKTAVYDRALSRMPYASAGVNVHKDGSIDLISYTTRVITISASGWIECTGTYSATTRKHISAFLKEYAPQLTYYDMKTIAATGDRLNIYTGEIAA